VGGDVMVYGCATRVNGAVNLRKDAGGDPVVPVYINGTTPQYPHPSIGVIIGKTVGTGNILIPSTADPLDAELGDIGYKAVKHTFTMTPAGTPGWYTNGHAYVTTAMADALTRNDLDPFTFNLDTSGDLVDGGGGDIGDYTITHDASWERWWYDSFMYDLWFPDVVTRWSFEYQ